MKNGFKPIIYESGMMWVLAKARKDAICFMSNTEIKSGDWVYRPISNGQNRMKRIKPGSMHKEGRN